MRSRSAAPSSLLRNLALCGALALVASCGWAGAGAGDAGAVPGAPTGVTAAAGSATSVHVMWNAIAGAQVYEVYRGTTKVTEVPGSKHMVDVTRLRPSTQYAFSVRARGADGRLGPPSRPVRAKTPAAVADDRSAPTRPAAPEGRAAGSRAVQLSWSASADDRGVVSYDIHQGDTKIHSVGGGHTATVLTGLRPATDYAFTVRARDAAGNVSPASPTVRLATPGTGDGRATAPTGFRATSHREDGAYHVDLSWVPPRVDGEIAEYQIHLDGRPATSLVYGGSAPRDRAAYSFYVGRKAGVTHRVRVRAMLPDGTWGGFSAERAVTTGAGR
ncbi:hydrolase [Streptomyces qaidamensis]|uniref:Hydrolase n=1 Tax=Streptomyces qaidamensis TaxID=1783515 RepID=A0A143BTR4_9ACTN|nr:fibronectin type III domain-containing protein [Streptomyces qaidamensis]AMW08647.1 hydrolase [Streptomyces qaidamensis]